MTNSDTHKSTSLSVPFSASSEKLIRHMQEVSRLALAEKNTDLFEYVVEVVQDLTGLIAVLWQIDETEEKLKIKAHNGLKEEYVKRAETPLEGSITGEALKKREPVCRQDIQNDSEKPEFCNLEEARKYGWRFFICVPLTGREGEPLGSLSLYGKNPQTYNVLLMKYLQTFANQVAIAIENREKRDKTEKLAMIIDNISQKLHLGVKAVLSEIALSARTLFGADYTAVFPYDPDKKLFYDREQIVIEGVSELYARTETPKPEGLAEFVRAAKEIFVYDVAKGHINTSFLTKAFSKKFNETNLIGLIQNEYFIKKHDIKTFVGMALVSGGSEKSYVKQEFGIIYINFCRYHQITQREIRIMRLFVRQIGTAIQKARLIEKEREQRFQNYNVLSALQDINKAIIEKTPSGVMELITDKIRELTGATYASFRMKDERGTHIMSVAAKGREPKKKMLEINEKSVSGWVAMTGQHIICPDVNNCKYYLKWDPEIKSCMCVPLKDRDGVIGTMYVESIHLGEFFDDFQVDFLQSLADQALITIQIFRHQQDSQVSALTKISEAITSLHEPDKVFEEILKEAKKLLPDTDFIDIRILEPNNELLAIAYLSDFLVEKYRRIKVGQGITGWVAKYKKLLHIRDVTKDDRYLPFYKNMGSEIAAPIVYGNEFLGVFNVEHRDIDAFSKDDVRMVKAIANFIANFIRTSRLSERLTKRADIFQDLNEVIASISKRSLNRDEILQLIADNIRKHFDNAFCVICPYDKEKDEFGHRIVSGIGLEKVGHPPRRNGTGRYILKTKKIRYFEDALSEPDDGGPAISKEIIEREEVKAAAHLPLMIGEESVIGILFVNFVVPYKFSENDKLILEFFSHQASLALTLDEDLRQKNRQLEQANQQLEMKAESLDEELRQKNRQLEQKVTDMRTLQIFSRELTRELN